MTDSNDARAVDWETLVCGRDGARFVTVAVEARDRPNATGAASVDEHFGGFEALRAVAACMVLLHHASSLAGGQVGRLRELTAVFDGGVAVFFVLSGFLLYRPMVRRDLAGHPSGRWRAFWWRRVLRIVPAYWLALTTLWALGAFELGDAWWRYYAFLQIYREDTVLGGIVPAWSLCTELAFYLVLPAFAAVVGRVAASVRSSRRVAVHLVACALLAAVGPLSRWGFDGPWASKRGLAFNWLPTNLDLFATGMVLAVLSAALAPGTARRTPLDRAASAVWPWWLAAGALFTWFAYRVGPTTIEAGYSGWYWHQRQFVLAGFTALVLVPMVFGDQQRGRARRVWGWRPLAWLGSVSYGLYLWHLDLMELAVEHRWLGLAAGPFGAVWAGPSAIVDASWFARVAPYSAVGIIAAVGLAAGTLVAAVSWYGLERPLGRFRNVVRSAPGAADR
jgi:peptidoglycan/LPS O-acetylase OafA/YrhL